MKLSVLTFVILLSALYLSAHVKHDKDDEIVKITTNLVFVPVTVKHKKGGFITNLGKNSVFLKTVSNRKSPLLKHLTSPLSLL